MDLSQITVGQEFSNYKSLCSALGLKQTTGEAKQKQLKDIERHIRLSRQGNRFKVEEILDYSGDILDNTSKSLYAKLIETLLIARLVGTNKPVLEFTYKQLFQELCMASDKYSDIYNDGSYEYFYHNIAPVSKDVYLDFRRCSYSENKKKIRTALESMRNRMLIEYEEEMWVCYDTQELWGEKEYHAKPSPDQVIEYLKISRRILEELGCDSYDELKEKFKTKEYEKRVAEAIREELGWKYTYKRVRIINSLSGSTGVLNRTRQYLMQEAGKKRVQICEEELNNAIKKMLNRVGERQHDNAAKRLEEWERGDEDWGMQSAEMPHGLLSILHRTRQDYLPSWNALSEYFISGDVEAAKDKGRDIKTDEENVDLET